MSRTIFHPTCTGGNEGHDLRDLGGETQVHNSGIMTLASWDACVPGCLSARLTTGSPTCPPARQPACPLRWTPTRSPALAKTPPSGCKERLPTSPASLQPGSQAATQASPEADAEAEAEAEAAKCAAVQERETQHNAVPHQGLPDLAMPTVANTWTLPRCPRRGVRLSHHPF